MRKQKSSAPQWYPEVFRANLIALQENVWHLMMNAICGANYSECFAKLAQNGSWQKMYQGCYQVKMDGFSDEFLGTWPKEGVMYGGTAFQLTLPADHFGVSELPLWPRPTATDGEAWTKTKQDDVRRSIWRYTKKGHTDRCIYHFIWHGLNPNQAADIEEMMTGFPKGWTDLSVSETPLCPRSSTPSSGQ